MGVKRRWEEKSVWVPLIIVLSRTGVDMGPGLSGVFSVVTRLSAVT